MPQCFVLMSFRYEDLNKLYFEVIKPTIERANYSCARVDEKPGGAYQITREIVREIEDADVILANLSYLSPNVFYELGIAHSFGTNVLMIARQGEEIPFDLKDHHVHFYSEADRSLESLRKYLRDSLTNTAWTKDPNNPAQLYSQRLAELLDFRTIEEKKTDNSKVARCVYDSVSTRHTASPRSHTVRHVVSICGGVATGKTTFARQLSNLIRKEEGGQSVSVLALDSYQIPRAEALRRSVPSGFTDDSWHIDEAASDLEGLISSNRSIYNRRYNHGSGQLEEDVLIKPSKYIIVDGIIAFHARLAPLSDFKLFIGGRHLRREQNLRIKVAYHERGYTLQQAVRQSEAEFSGYRSYLLPLRRLADAILDIEDDHWTYRINFEPSFD
jgi:uridine kinase